MTKTLVITSKWLVRPLACILGLVALTGANPVSAAEWKTIAPATGGFTCEMPGQPEEHETPAGLVKVTVYFLKLPEAAYLVNSTKIPAEAEKETDEKRLDIARDGAVSSSKGILIEEKKITLNGYPGRQLLIEQPGGLFSHLRFFMTDNHLVQAAAASMSKETSKDMDRFFKSLKLSKN